MALATMPRPKKSADLAGDGEGKKKVENLRVSPETHRVVNKLASHLVASGLAVRVGGCLHSVCTGWGGTRVFQGISHGLNP